MRVLITIPHVFAPQKGSLYSSQNEEKRHVKQAALLEATIGNLIRHGREHWIHASLGYKQPVITRKLATFDGVDLTIQLYTPTDATLSNNLPSHPNLKIIYIDSDDYAKIPAMASRSALEQAAHYDLVGYIEDDILIEDVDLLKKILYLENLSDSSYAFMPHRCELIPQKGDVILSGDPDGGRADLYWDTGEVIEVSWPLGNKRFYRATNPHSGCYFLSSKQALRVLNYWQNCNWVANFQLSGPLEQAASGMLLPVLKIMKPTPAHYRFLMLRHQDELWRRHPEERA